MSRKRDEYETNYNENRRLEPMTKKLRSPIGSDHQSDIHDSNGKSIAFERKSSAGPLAMDANGLVSSGILKPAQVHDRREHSRPRLVERAILLSRFPFRIRGSSPIYSNDLFCLFFSPLVNINGVSQPETAIPKFPRDYHWQSLLDNEPTSHRHRTTSKENRSLLRR